MRLNKTILGTVFLVCVLGFFSPSSAQVYDYVVLDGESGISSTKIADITQDQHGYLWIATHAGVSRFDGKQFVNYHEKEGLAENRCSSIFCDKDNNIWVGHQSGGLSVIYKDSIQTISEADGLGNNEIHDIFQDADGKMWVATFGGLSSLENAVWTTLTIEDGLASNNIQCIAQDEAGQMWVGTYGAGVNVLNDGIAAHLHMGNGLVNNYVTSLAHSDGKMVIGTLGGLTAFDGDKFVSIAGLELLINNQINGISVETNGALWLATFNGASRISDGKTLNITEENGLPHNEVTCVFTDNENNIWIGSTVGLIRPRNLAFGHHFSTEELDLDPSCLFVDSKQRLWGGNQEGGAVYFDDDGFVSAFTDPDINDHQISAIAEDATGNLWFGTMDFGGLFRWDGERFYIYSDEFGLADNNINCLLTGKDGLLFIGTPNGLSTYDGEGFSMVFLSDEFASNNVTCLAKEADGSVLIGAEDGSVFRFVDGDAQPFPGLAINARITSIATSELGIAFSTISDGIWLSRNGSISHISEEKQLQNTSIQSLAFLGSRLFAGTTNSVLEILLEEDSAQVRRYARVQGFVGGSCNRAAIATYQNRIFIGTEKGVVAFNPSELQPDLKEPITLLTELQLSYETVDWQRRGYETRADGLPQKLSLSFTDNNLRFFFSGVNHKYPDQVTYSWKLEGYEQNWTPANDQNKVNYSSLPPGDYVFKLIACNSNGICSSEPVEYAFSIKPPFYRTWWFYTLLVVAIVAGAYLYVKQRERRLLEEKQILESTVEERTKELREQKEIVEHQNQHITESIEYASNIQKAILPSEQEMKVAFLDHFVFYRPKEAVGGDFYWAYHSNDVSWAAAVDCTGHGVSGAFMSMIGSDLLNQIIIEKKLTDPARVLEEMDKGIKLAFAQSAKEFESDQGMDVSLVRIDRKKKALQFAGAQRPLFIFVDGELSEVECDRFSISCADQLTKTFTSHTVVYTDESTVYLFSDGITDQFGGDRGKKFMLRRVREFLQNNHTEKMDLQHTSLIKTFDDWKGEGNNQIDDVMLMGIRL